MSEVEDPTATWTQRHRPLGHPGSLYQFKKYLVKYNKIFQVLKHSLKKPAHTLFPDIYG